MLIQPLIENAILHGIIGSGILDAHIAVSLKRLDQTLIITVIDNGIGLHGKTNKMVVNVNKEKSIGLKSIEERIKLPNTQYQTTALRNAHFRSYKSNAIQDQQIFVMLFNKLHNKSSGECSYHGIASKNSIDFLIVRYSIEIPFSPIKPGKLCIIYSKKKTLCLIVSERSNTNVIFVLCVIRANQHSEY